MEKVQHYFDYVYVVHEFLSKPECDRYIAMGEQLGFADAPITTHNGPVMRKDIRNNERVMTDDVQVADALWDRAQNWVVSPFRGRRAVGLNERFRFYRYEPGQSFAAHYDGRFARENGEQSEYTFLIYLNDDFTGGGTTFYKPERFEIQPRTGSLLLFHHPQLHEGSVVEFGAKYVLRSDVMYENESATKSDTQSLG